MGQWPVLSLFEEALEFTWEKQHLLGLMEDKTR